MLTFFTVNNYCLINSMKDFLKIFKWFERNLFKILELNRQDITLDKIKKILTVDESGKERVFFNQIISAACTLCRAAIFHVRFNSVIRSQAVSTDNQFLPENARRI